MRIIAFICWLWSLTAVWGVELTAPPTVSVTPSNAVVEWHTAESCGTRAQATPGSAKVSVPDKSVGTDHRVLINGLQPGVQYSVTIGSARVWLATNTFTTTGSSAPAANSATTKSATATATAPAPDTTNPPAPPTRKIWGNLTSLSDHFTRHGSDFNAKDADDYARMSWEFLQRAKAEGFPAKVDTDGVLRVYEPASGTFASYNHNGTTKTFFKPGSRDYFNRQPGKSIDLKTWK